MSITETKQSGNLYFLSQTRPVLSIGPFEAIIHLFEHEYSKFTFAYGVADVACSLPELASRAKSVGMPNVTHEYSVIPANFDYIINLEDGRMGPAIWHNSSYSSDEESQEMHISFIFELGPPKVVSLR
jgi:hypothetical protein